MQQVNRSASNYMDWSTSLGPNYMYKMGPHRDENKFFVVFDIKTVSIKTNLSTFRVIYVDLSYLYLYKSLRQKSKKKIKSFLSFDGFSIESKGSSRDQNRLFCLFQVFVR